MKENLKTDKMFREKLEGYSSTPPAHIWDNVQGQLMVFKRRRRRMIAGWISAAAVVVLAFMAGWYFNDSKVLPESVADNTKDNTSKTEIINEKAQGQTPGDTPSEKIRVETEPEVIYVAEVQKPREQSFSKATAEIRDVPDHESVREKISMKLLAMLDFRVINKIPEGELKQTQQKGDEFFNTTYDRILLAENIRNYASEGERETGWKLGMHVSPGYDSYEASHNSEYVTNMMGAEKAATGNLGAGFSIQYKTSKKLRIESGLYYAQSGQKSGNALPVFALKERNDFAPAPDLSGKAYFANSVHVQDGNIYMNSTAGVIQLTGPPQGAEITASPELADGAFSETLMSTGEFSQVFDFVEIPLYLRYRLVDAKLGIEVMGGMNAGLVVGNNAYLSNEFGLQNVGRTRDISTMNFSGTLGLGVNYGLGKHISVSLEPRINYYLSSINKNAAVDYRPYRVGIYTGLYYEF